MPTFLAANMLGRLSVIASYVALCVCLRLSSAGSVYGFILAGPRSVLGVGAIYASNMGILNTIPVCFTRQVSCVFRN